MTGETSESIHSQATDKLQFVQDIAFQTLQRVQMLAMDQLGEEQITRFGVALADTTLKAYKTCEQIEGETEEQHANRLGWIIQSAGIKYLDDSKVSWTKWSPWRDALMLEILSERETAKGNLPGVLVKFRYPYMEYLDDVSRNSIIIDFSDTKELTGVDNLAITTIFSQIAQDVGVVKAIWLLYNFESLPTIPNVLLAQFVNELASWFPSNNQPAKKDSEEVKKIRFSLIKALFIKYPDLRHEVDVRHTTYNNSQSLSIGVMKNSRSPDRRFFRAHLHVRPNEVTPDFWDFLRGLHKSPDTVPTWHEDIPASEEN